MSDEAYALPQHLTIRSIHSIHAALREKIDENQRLNLHIPDDAEIDLSALQLIESARLYSITHGKIFVLDRPASGALRDALERSGWLVSADKDQALFWLHEGAVQ